MNRKDYQKSSHTEKDNQTVKVSMGAQSADMPGFLKGDFTHTMQSTNSTRFHNGKKVFPSHKFGLSYESPTYFSNKFSLLCKDSYDNPYIKNPDRQTGKNKIPSSRLRNIEDYNINEQRFENTQQKLPKLIKITNLITNQDCYVQKPLIKIEDNKFSMNYIQIEHFKKKRELFTDFIEKNDVLNVYGPLNMRDRPKNFRVTKDYAYDPEKQKAIQKAKSQSPHNKSANCFNTNPNDTKSSILQKNSIPDLSQCLNIFGRNMKVTKSDKITGRSKPQLPSLQIIRETLRDGDKFIKRDQAYLNDFQNSLIRESIKENMDKLIVKNVKIPYNSDRKQIEFQDNDGIIIDPSENQDESEINE